MVCSKISKNKINNTLRDLSAKIALLNNIKKPLLKQTNNLICQRTNPFGSIRTLFCGSISVEQCPVIISAVRHVNFIIFLKYRR